MVAKGESCHTADELCRLGRRDQSRLRAWDVEVRESDYYRKFDQGIEVAVVVLEFNRW